MAERNRRVTLVRRPTGIPTPDDFQLDAVEAPVPGDGEFLVRNLYLSIDPAQRGWASDVANYASPSPLGEAMRALAVGVVIASRHPDYAVGDHLYGLFGWQTLCAAGPAAVLRRVDPHQAPLSTAASLFGINGLAAYLALTRCGEPKSGGTVLVSTAAGAVGSLVGQIARNLGCRPIGLTGTEEKVERCLRDFGFAAAANYKTGDVGDFLDRAAPEGLDIFFDNTGGAILAAALTRMAVRGRIVQCGTASIASWTPKPNGPRVEREILTRRLRWQGFVIFDHLDAFEAAVTQLDAWRLAGLLRCDEDISDDLAEAPAALAGLYRGENRGKRLIRLPRDDGGRSHTPPI
jgi:NADPH-dependent curcumin reductase CurA